MIRTFTYGPRPLTPGTRALLCASISSLALCAGTAAAQTSATSDGRTVTEVVVTGTRTERAGFQTPTPVTVLGAESLRNSATGQMAEAVLQLPQLRASQGSAQVPAGSQGGGQVFLNLRAVGPQRTLTLLDGKRFVPTQSAGALNVAGSVGVEQFPSAVIERVEVVTGGASAAYGSDAVAGVANFIINRRFTGLALSAGLGTSEHDDRNEVKGSFAAGGDFGGGQGHVVLSAEYFDAGAIDGGGRPWARRNERFIRDNRGVLIRASDVRFSNASFNGVFTNSPTNGTLVGVGFDKNGAPIPFNYGQFAVPSNSPAAFAAGGDGVPSVVYSGDIASSINRKIGYGRVSWDFGADWTIYAEGNLAQTRNVYHNIYDLLTARICPANAYLPASLVSRTPACTATAGGATLGLNAFTLGRRINTNTNELQRVVAGFEGRLGEVWKLDGYFTHGRLAQTVEQTAARTANFSRATNAVLSNGQIVCADTLSATASIRDVAAGCVPFNPFGQTTPTAAQLAYLRGVSLAHQVNTQDVAAINLAGEPFSLPAGPVSVATGFEYRRDKTNQTSDGLSQANAFTAGNFKPFSGSQHVEEGYLEVIAPLLKDQPMAESLELNGAIRYTHYSLAGNVTTWKVGLTYSPVEDIKFRATRSRDIRAPSLDLLFNNGARTQISITDGANGGYLTASNSLANPALKPEKANTTTVGVVLQPRFAPALSLSADWYNIDLKGAIATLSAQQTVNICSTAASAETCAQVVRGANGLISQVNVVPLNLNQFKTNGVDFEGVYRTSLWADAPLTLRGILTYVHTLRSSGPGIPTQEGAGDLSAFLNGLTGGVPHWRGTLQATVQAGPWTVFAQERYIGSGHYGNATTDVTNGFTSPYKIPAVSYTDVNLRYRLPWSKDLSVYGSVNNLFNKEPPFPTNQILHDAVGRYYRIGVDAKF